MLQSNIPISGHNHKNSKNRVQYSTKLAHGMGSHMTYKVYIKLHKIIGFTIPWPVLMSKLCVKGLNEIFVCLKFVIV